MKIEKLDEKTIAVTRENPVTATYTLKSLRAQRKQIVAQQKADNDQRDLEIADIDELIAQCNALDIVDESIESETTE